jgi:hypothetical protein
MTVLRIRAGAMPAERDFARRYRSSASDRSTSFNNAFVYASGAEKSISWLPFAV